MTTPRGQQAPYVPRPYETVRVASEGDALAVVIVVNAGRARALVQLEDGAESVRRWVWFGGLSRVKLEPGSFQDFLSRRARVYPGCWVRSGALYRALNGYRAILGLPPLSWRVLQDELRRLGLEPETRGGGRMKYRCWRGIAICPDGAEARD